MADPNDWTTFGPWIAQLESLRAVPKIAAAAGMGAVIGWEREARDRPAGLRTHVIVAVSTALVVILGDVIMARHGGQAGMRLDGLRLLEAIVAGVAFIGAGTIFSAGSEHRVRGLTTAATLLGVAVLGAACGLGLYALAAATTVLLVIVLRGLGRLERRVKQRSERDGD